MSKNKELPRPPSLKSFEELTEEVHLPSDFAIALMAARPELLKIIKRPLTEDETAAVAAAMAVLIDTNQALQQHARQVSEMAVQTLGHIKGVSGKLYQLADFADFREPTEEDADDV